MSVPREVRELISRFRRNKDVYRSNQYNETQLRREFIDPFFTALGWDVANVQGYAEAYKDVVHEDAIKVGGATKAPDYCFRIGGTRKFFVEAKRPAVRIKEDAASAYQLRRYAWSAKLPLSILTNFAEFAVYDCRFKPDKKDSAAKARVLYFTYEEYEARWDEIANIFAKEAVYKGSFDRYAESTKRKRGTAEVDAAFLKEIEGWREALARNIALRNPKLSQRELNFAVQRTIDRIIFLRICEDRGVEEYGRLMALLNGPRVYPRLVELFRRADERYNSGLFHFRREKGRTEPPDELTPALVIDDKVLKDIIRQLYYPDSPYEFSVLPANILGQVYEQFLGKVIRLTPAHRAKVEEKPEVRKAGGVYYTPTYIVDYIVKHTVGKLLEGKTPQEVGGLTKNWRPSKRRHPLRILDPACGSGSFLLGAYQYLLDWYRDRYVEDRPEKHAKGKHPRLFRGPGGEWRLTTAERKRILLTHIYGVDIDPQAVEVTKLSLLLKVLEGETSETLERQLKLFHERALPDLGRNIKCGNSLVGPDFYETADIASLDREELLHINPFDWHTEFPEVFQAGGFDAVIGNPPYISFGLRGAQKLEKCLDRYLRNKYPHSAEYKLSTYAIFINRAIDLLKDKCRLAFIVPDSFLLGRYFSKLRRYILDTCAIDQIVLFAKDFWPSGTVGLPVILVLQKASDEDYREENFLTARLCQSPHEIIKGDFEKSYSYKQSYFETVAYNRFRLFFDESSKELVEKLERKGVAAKEIVNIYTGVRSKIGQRKIVSERPEGPTWQQGLISGKEINRYFLNYTGHYINIDPKLLWSGGWDKEIVKREKLLMRQTGDSLIVAFDSNGYYHLNNLHSIVLRDNAYNLRYVLGVLNSKLLNHYYHLISLELGRAMAQTDIETIEKLPIRAIDFSDPSDKAHHDKMVELVQRMLDLHKQLAAAETEHEKTVLQRQIAVTDRQIDQLVYELYGLSNKEIKTVERFGREAKE